MTLWVCVNCTTKYAVGLFTCPRCKSTEFVEDGQPMPKITVHGGASDATLPATEQQPEPEPATSGTVADVPPAGEPVSVEVPDAVAALVTDPGRGESPSPGSDSSASSEQPSSKTPASEPCAPGPAPSTANRSRKARKGSSAAGTTGGSTPATGPQDKLPAGPDQTDDPA